jgi:Cd2+/Zn2+-exporting ATPase
MTAGAGGTGTTTELEAVVSEQDPMRYDVGPPAGPPAKAVTPGEAPPLHPAIATAHCAGSALAGWVIGPSTAAPVLYALSYAAGGAMAAITAVAELRRRRLSVDLLMVLAAAGAAVLGDWGEGAVLLFLFSLSGTLEAYALYRTTRSIDALIKLRPREASRVRDGYESRAPIEALTIDDVIRVRPGERFPVDGEVIEGETWADEATLTGESEPVGKAVGDPVFAGTINGRGSVLIRMTRAVADTTLERIVRLVRDAQAEKTAAQLFVESWRGPYVAGVLLAAAFVFVGSGLLHRQGFTDAFYQAMVILVVASPCAVVVGAPAVLLSAITRAARQGVLFKGGAHLEMLGHVDTIAFDKTGTITRGRPTVADVWAADGLEPDRLLGLAAAAERRSEHHLAAAVVAEADRRGLATGEVDDFETHTGEGVHAHADGLWIGVGREALFASHDRPVPPAVAAAGERIRERGQTALLVVLAGDGPPTGGVIALADLPRPDAAAALGSLRRSGISSILVLTGDHERVARAVARRVGADEVRSGLLPGEKVLELRRLMNAGHRLAMVGDGVNDAPALATADVGIAMGGAGTDVALEVADVVLMRDDLRSLSFAVWLSRLARRRVRRNLAFAFTVIGVLVLSSFFGLPLWLGVVGHEGSTLLVVLSGLRLLWESPPGEIPAGEPGDAPDRGRERHDRPLRSRRRGADVTVGRGASR